MCTLRDPRLTRRRAFGGGAILAAPSTEVGLLPGSVPEGVRRRALAQREIRRPPAPNSQQLRILAGTTGRRLVAPSLRGPEPGRSFPVRQSPDLHAGSRRAKMGYTNQVGRHRVNGPPRGTERASSRRVGNASNETSVASSLRSCQERLKSGPPSTVEKWATRRQRRWKMDPPLPVLPPSRRPVPGSAERP